MFKRVDNVNYILDKSVCDELHTEVSKVVNDMIPKDVVDETILSNTIKELISLRVSILVKTHLEDPLVKNGFLAISIISALPLVVTVGIVEKKVVYGVLIK